MSELYGAMKISAYGMKAQSQRTRVIAENLANASTGPEKLGQNPYIRKTITFKNELNRAEGVDLVNVDKISQAKGDNAFVMKYMPDHPAADAKGYVKMPNIDPIIETMDMREAQRTYEANLGMIEQSRSMMMQAIDLMKR